MKKVILCTTTRNHLRFLIPLIENLCKRSIVILYCNVSEVANDSLYPKLIEFVYTYKTFSILDLSKKDTLLEVSKSAESLLVTSGTSNRWHHLDYTLCKEVSCKSYAIQHGLSQEGITRLPEYHFSADHVFTWVKERYILEDASTHREKFIPIGVPNHYYEKSERIENSKVFFMTKCFDARDDQDIKLDTSSSEWKGIYTSKWKKETWDIIGDICSDDEVCIFVRHPTAFEDLHPKLEEILKRKNKILADNKWIKENNLLRSQLYSMGSKYYVIYPSSCFVDCRLNGLDYELFVDYNSNVPVLTDLQEVIVDLNVTKKIADILLGDKI